MSYTNILCEVAEGVATVTVNRPDKMNALNGVTIGELDACFADLGADESVRVVILTGAGEKAFVAGADIGEMAAMNATDSERLATRGQGLMNRIENLGKPVIAAVNGFALGGGCELAMACTFRYASDNAKLGLPETGLGLIPGFGGTQRLSRLVGRGRALEMILLGNMITAVDAMAIGLVNTVFPQAEFADAVKIVARALAEKSTFTLRLALQAVNDGLLVDQDSGCRLEAALFGIVGASGDAHEGCSAFMEKRKPNFQDR
ncbi:MAG: enoyl-CoA hydratase-related protein [Candidatus Krumholzibacteria bacterium]|nr:enoyl-CoA hydratase-related protein [Candidatus Krumholzibacteria bacterium]